MEKLDKLKMFYQNTEKLFFPLQEQKNGYPPKVLLDKTPFFLS